MTRTYRSNRFWWIRRSLSRTVQRLSPLWVALGLAVLVASVFGIVSLEKGPPTVVTSPVSTRTTTARHHSRPSRRTSPVPIVIRHLTHPVIGVYAGPAGALEAAELGSELGHPVTLAFDYLDGSSWKSITQPWWVLDQWQATHFVLAFGVPMLPAHGASLAAGAAGAYDGEFAALGRFLVGHDEANALLVLGWTPEETGTPWSVSNAKEAADYTLYWRRIVTAMDDVAGARFRFVWEPGASFPGVALRRIYPGNHYVSAVGVLLFDDLATRLRPGVSRWQAVADTPLGPNAVAAFGEANHKALVAMLGLVSTKHRGGGGDDPRFVRSFYSWARLHEVQDVFLWDFGGSALSEQTFPASLATLRQLDRTPAR